LFPQVDGNSAATAEALSMKIGFGLPNFGLMGTRDIILTLTRETEKLGYDSLWAGERLLYPTQPKTFPFHNPAHLAKAIASLDVLSNGRAVICAGQGWDTSEYAQACTVFVNAARVSGDAVGLRRQCSSPDADRICGAYDNPIECQCPRLGPLEHC
jgi:hypothetical protein